MGPFEASKAKAWQHDTTIGELNNSWERETSKYINQLAIVVDFTMRAERYAEDVGDKFLADKARETLLKIKGKN